MKKILFVLLSLVIVFCTSCLNHRTQHYENKQIDTAILGKATDSIFAANPGDLYNDVIENDIKNALVNYFKKFKDKNIPAINELEFMYSNVQDMGEYCYVIMECCHWGPYYSEPLSKNIVKEMKVKFQIDREAAKQFSHEGEDVITYKITDCKFCCFDMFSPDFYKESDLCDSTKTFIRVDYKTLHLKDVKFEKIN